MVLSDLLAQAQQGVLSHRLRAVLSSLGIVIGIAAVVATFAIGEGGRRAAMADIGTLGINNLYVRALTTTGRAGRQDAPLITRADADALRSSIPGLAGTVVARYMRTEVSSHARSVTAPVAGVSSQWSELANLTVIRGRWLAAEDDRLSRRVAVVGPALAQRLEASADPVGQLVSAAGTTFRVVGVLEKAGHGPNAAALESFDPDGTIFVPVTAMDGRLGDQDAAERVSEIGARTTGDVEAVAAQVDALMSRRHPGSPRPYELVVPRQLLRAKLRAQRTFDAVLLGTGFVALMISGIGIMNVMLASVAERTQEIGVRRALGARQREIVQQFALEAAILCAGGGCLGVPVGVLMAAAVSLVAGWTFALSAGGIAVALGLAVSVGLLFGIYPAYLAASTDPIDALRA